MALNRHAERLAREAKNKIRRPCKGEAGEFRSRYPFTVSRTLKVYMKFKILQTHLSTGNRNPVERRSQGDTTFVMIFRPSVGLPLQRGSGRGQRDPRYRGKLLSDMSLGLHNVSLGTRRVHGLSITPSHAPF